MDWTCQIGELSSPSPTPMVMIVAEKGPLSSKGMDRVRDGRSPLDKGELT